LILEIDRSLDMTMRPSDFTPIIDLATEPGPGPKRKRHPIYVDLLPPCNDACPAGENIQAWLAHARAGRYHEAWLTLVKDNPLPAVHGRVCYHPCETNCNRQHVDSAVSIHAVERFLGDLVTSENWQLPIDAPASGKRVFVVGTGVLYKLGILLSPAMGAVLMGLSTVIVAINARFLKLAA
jgi:formate dehydrogenase beta subunit